MESFFKELYNYTHRFNQDYIRVLVENSDKVPDKAIKLMSHIANAQQIWNNRIEKTSEPVTVWQLHPVEHLKEMDRRNFEESIRLLTNVDFNRKVDYVTSQGKNYSNTVRDILFHVVNHSTYHRAQIASELKALGLEPPVSDYIFFKR